MADMLGGVVSGLVGLVAPVFLFAQLPSSSNFKLDSYGIGTGGTAGSSSSSYQLEGISGEVSTGQVTGTDIKTAPGFVYSEQANVPTAPTFTNPSNYYDKLHFVIATASNPSDAKYAIAISSDDFATTNYIQNDNTVGASLGTEDYQTYANWGGASGEDVIGLSPSTTYKIKVKATSGKFTESGFGPTASAATVGPTLSFSLSPSSINFGSLSSSSVSTSSEITATFATNANNGGKIYIYDSNSGLDSASTSDTITSATADLAVATSGYGARSTSATQSSGGPLSAQSPYNGSGDNVGILDTTIRSIYATTGPITGGSGVFVLKAKPGTLNKPAGDYADTVTLVAAGEF